MISHPQKQERQEQMKNAENRWVDLSNGVAWAIVFSLTAIIMGIIALSTSYPRTDLSLDYMGVIVGILALLVTTLVGWQVFSLIKIDRLKDNLENAELRAAEVREELSKDIHELSAQSSILHIMNFTSNFNVANPNVTQARLIYCLSIQTLYNQLKSKDTSYTDTCLTVMAICLHCAHLTENWDSIFNENTTKMANKMYLSMLSLSSILPIEQINHLTRIHDSRIRKEFHESLHSLTTPSN